MVGDRMSDLEAGRAAGCAGCCLVRTGYGVNVADSARAAGFPVADDLPAAIKDAYAIAAQVRFDNAYCRKDIGQRALKAFKEG